MSYYIANFSACSTVAISSAPIALISIIGIFIVMIIVIAQPYHDHALMAAVLR